MIRHARVGSVIAGSFIKRGNKKTTILVILVLTLIFVNLVLTPALINGLGTLFTDSAIDYLYGNIIVEPGEDNIYIENSNSVVQKINSISTVDYTTKRLRSGATLSYKDRFQSVSILGVDPDQEILISNFDDVIVEGDYLGSGLNEILLGRFVAGEEGAEAFDDLGGVKPGNIITVTYSNGVVRDYKVKGIFAGGTGISDILVLVNFKELENALDIVGEDKASEIIIKTSEFAEEGEVKNTLLELGVKEDISTWQEKIQALIEDIINSFNALTLVSSVVSTIVAIFVLFMVVYINTLNKKKQIGILKAVGVSPSSIIFAYILISITYVILGILFGGLVMFLIVFYLIQNPITFATTNITPAVQSSVLIQSIVNLMITAVIAGFIPAWLVARQDILKSIWGR